LCVFHCLKIIGHQRKQRKYSHAFLHKKRIKIEDRRENNGEYANIANIRRTIYWRMIFLKYIAGTTLAIWNCEDRGKMETRRNAYEDGEEKRSFVLSRIKDVNILLVK
jgi:hypothetical protein